MTHPEERLAELGLSVPEVAKPVAVYVPAVRSGHHVFTVRPAADARRRADGDRQGRRRGQPEEAVACAQQCALNAIAAVRAEIGTSPW